MATMTIGLRAGVSPTKTEQRIRAADPDAAFETRWTSLKVTTARPGSILRQYANLLNDSRWVNIDMETDR